MKFANYGVFFSGKSAKMDYLLSYESKNLDLRYCII